MIFLDTNIPMYLVGAPHPHKDAARRLLEAATVRQERLVTDAEVLQEVLHRYDAIQRRDAIEPAFALIHGLVDEIVPIQQSTVERARTILAESAGLSARDAVHVAAMEEAGVDRIMSFDTGFDTWQSIERIG